VDHADPVNSLSRCRNISVAPGRIEVEGLDAIDGSPVPDIKPWMEEFAPRGAARHSAWATELMARYDHTEPTDA
jgi:tRNA (Thr-GGU) A37 N-methylase